MAGRKVTGTGTVEERLQKLEQALNFAEAVLVVPAVGTEDTSGGAGGSSGGGDDTLDWLGL